MAQDKMHRTQISLEQWQYQYLREYARKTKTSISEVIRQMITEAVQAKRATRPQDDPIFGVIGLGEGSGAPVSRDHDRYLYGNS